MTVQLVHQNPWFAVSREERNAGDRSDEERTTWYRVISADSAMVVPVTAEGEIVLIHGLRDTTGPKPLYELPCGAIDPGESAVAAALRELREETGITAKSFRLLGEFYASPGISAAKTAVFEATELLPGEPDNEPGEDWATVRVTAQELNRLIIAGFLRDAGTLSALLLRNSA